MPITNIRRVGKETEIKIGASLLGNEAIGQKTEGYPFANEMKWKSLCSTESVHIISNQLKAVAHAEHESTNQIECKDLKNQARVCS